jgi:hypothetical protein
MQNGMNILPYGPEIHMKSRGLQDLGPHVLNDERLNRVYLDGYL